MTTHTGSGNTTWVDFPSTSTLITASTLENIENQLDRAPADLGCMLRRSADGQNLSLGNQIVTYATSIATTTHVTVTSNTVFTLNTTGLWCVSAGVGDQSATANQLTLWIEVAGGGNRFCQQSAGAAGAVGYPNANVSNILPITGGTQLSVGVWGSAASTFGSDAQTFVSLTLLRRS